MASNYYDPWGSTDAGGEGMSPLEWEEYLRRKRQLELLKQYATEPALPGEPPLPEQTTVGETPERRLERLRKPLPGLETAGLEGAGLASAIEPLEPMTELLGRAGQRSTAKLLRGFVAEPISLARRAGRAVGLINETPSPEEHEGWVNKVKRYAEGTAAGLEQAAEKSRRERKFTNEWAEAGENILEGLLAAPADVLPIMAAGKAKVGMGAYMALKAYAQGKSIPEALAEGGMGYLLGKGLQAGGELTGEYGPRVLRQLPETLRALVPPTAGAYLFGGPIAAEQIAAGKPLPEVLGATAESAAVGAALSPGRGRRPFEEQALPRYMVEAQRKVGVPDEVIEQQGKIPEDMKTTGPSPGEVEAAKYGEPTVARLPEALGPPTETPTAAKPAEPQVEFPELAIKPKEYTYKFNTLPIDPNIKITRDPQGGGQLAYEKGGNDIGYLDFDPSPDGRGFFIRSIDSSAKGEGVGTALWKAAAQLTNGPRRGGRGVLSFQDKDAVTREMGGQQFAKSMERRFPELVDSEELTSDIKRMEKIKQQAGLTAEYGLEENKPGGVNVRPAVLPSGDVGAGRGAPEAGGVGPSVRPAVGEPGPRGGGAVEGRRGAAGEAPAPPEAERPELAPGDRVTYPNQITGKPEGGVVNAAGTLITLDGGGVRPIAAAVAAGARRVAPPVALEAPQATTPRPEGYTAPTVTGAPPEAPRVAPAVAAPAPVVPEARPRARKPGPVRGEGPDLTAQEQVEFDRTMEDAATRWTERFPEMGGKITKTGAGLQIQLKNGNKILVQENVPEITVEAEAETKYREIHPEIPETTRLRAHGKTMRIGPNALIQIAKNAQDGTDVHEVTHVAYDMGVVTRAEDSVLGNKYAKEIADPVARQEAIAEGIAKEATPKFLRRFTARVLSLGEMLQNAAAKVGLAKEAVPSERRVVTDVRTGRVLRRGAKTLEEMRAKYSLKPEEERKPAPVFYSKLQRTIDERMPNVTSPDQVRGIVRSGGVKPEEVEWSGLEEFLVGKKAVTKADLLQHLRENDVQVQEVVKPESENVEFQRIKAKVERNEPLTPAEEELYGTHIPSRTEGTKFQQYALPGGENYRELLLTMPPKTVREQMGTMMIGHPETGFRGAHWDEPNVLAHVRFNDRTDADGKRVLFLEEVQSDWHQKGREEGYTASGLSEKEIARTRELQQKNAVNPGAFTDAELVELTDLLKRNKANVYGVPNAPFKKSWPELAMKRMIRWAAENGYNKIAWTTGEQQAERYDLSKQVEGISYAKQDNGNYSISALRYHGDVTHVGRNIPSDRLANYVGKDVAQKIIDNVGREPGVPSGAGTLRGLDLKVGGEGMGGFYDQILPEVANKIGKRFGARVGVTEIGAGEIPGGAEGGFWKPETATVHSLDITPAMRESVVYEGQPKFKLTPEEEKQAAAIEGVEPEGAAAAREKYRGRGAMAFTEPTTTAVRAGAEKTAEAVAAPETPRGGKPPEEFINFDRITNEADVQKALQAMADAHPEEMKAARGYRSQDKAAERSRYFTQSDLDRIIKEEGRVSDAVVFGAKQAAVAGGRAVAEAAKNLEKARVDEKGVDEAEKEYLKVYNKALGTYLTSVRAGAEAGRALAMGNRIAEGMSKEDAMFQFLLKKQADPRLVAELTKLDLSNPEIAMKAIRAASKPRVADMIQEYMLSAMMSGPATHIRNFVSNSVMQLGKFPEKLAASWIDAAYSRGTGAERERYAGEVGKEAGALARELWQTLHFTGNAAKAAADVWQERGDVNWGKIEATHVPALPGKVGKFIRGPLRAAGASDAWFGTIAAQQEISARTYRLAKNDVKSGKAKDVQVRMQEILSNLDSHPDILRAAKKARDYWTFRDELGPRSKKVLGLLNDMGIMRLAIAPFFKTPVKITGRFIERSPIGLMRTLAKMAKKQYGTRGEAEDDLARGLMGTAMAGAIYGFAQMGNVSGMGPSDTKKKTNKMATGWQPYSIKIGDTYYSYQGMEPLSSLLMAASNVYEVTNAKDHDKWVGETFRAAKDVAVDKTSLQGFQRISLAIGDPERWAKQFAQGLVGMPIPAVVARTAAAIDQTVRRRDTFWDVIRSRIPGMTGELEPRRTITGKEVVREQTPLETFASPFQRTKERPAPLERELDRLGYVPVYAPRKVVINKKDYELTQEQMQFYVEADKKAAAEALSTIKKRYYQSAPEEPTPGMKTKQEILRDIWAHRRALARMQVVRMVMRGR